MLFAPPQPRRRPAQRTLREYQRATLARVGAALYRRPLVVAPTGSGKTVMGSAIVKELDLPTLWLAHRTELIDQAAKSLRDFGLHVGIIKAGRTPDRAAPIQVASVQSLRNRRCPPAGLIVPDEAHHAEAETYQEIFRQYPGVPLVGLTATPFRLDGRGLGNTFGEIVVSAYADELIAAGWLHAPKVYAARPPDLKGVKITGGDYNLSQLAKRLPIEMSSEIVRDWIERCWGKRTVAFCVNVEHSVALAQAFVDAGIRAEHIDGSTGKDQRREVLARLAGGETLVVCNCMILTEGWDLPSLECAIIARPTASLNLHLQMIGRVMRACEGKAGAIVLDHAGNHHIHGLVTRRLEYSLDGSKSVGAADPLGLRQCGKCFVLYESSLPACPECGTVPAPRKASEAPVGEFGPLEEFSEDFEYRRRMWDLFENQRIECDYKAGFPMAKYHERFSEWPIVAEIEGRRELVDPTNATFEQRQAAYLSLLETARAKGMQDGWAAHRYRDQFGVWPRGFVDRAAITAKFAGVQQ